MKKLWYIGIAALVLSLTACNSNVNQKIAEQWGMEIETSTVSIEEAEGEAEGSGILEQQSKAEQVGEEVYEKHSDKTMQEYNDGLASLVAYENNGERRSLSEVLILTFYQLLGTLRAWSVPIIIITVVVGAFLFIFSRYNKQLRRFSVGLIVVVFLLWIFIIFGTGILNEIFFY